MLGGCVFPLYLNGLTAIVIIRTISPDDNYYYNEKTRHMQARSRRIPAV